MDDVLREALILQDAEKMLGPRRICLEYRAGELYEGAATVPQLPESSPEPVAPICVDKTGAALDDARVEPV
jgi:hypothetical protein